MTRYASFIALAAILTFGIGTAVSFAGEPAPAEQKEKKGMTSGKAGDEKNKDEKKDMGGKPASGAAVAAPRLLPCHARRYSVPPYEHAAWRHSRSQQHSSVCRVAPK